MLTPNHYSLSFHAYLHLSIYELEMCLFYSNCHRSHMLLVTSAITVQKKVFFIECYYTEEANHMRMHIMELFAYYLRINGLKNQIVLKETRNLSLLLTYNAKII